MCVSNNSRRQSNQWWLVHRNQHQVLSNQRNLIPVIHKHADLFRDCCSWEAGTSKRYLSSSLDKTCWPCTCVYVLFKHLNGRKCNDGLEFDQSGGCRLIWQIIKLSLLQLQHMHETCDYIRCLKTELSRAFDANGWPGRMMITSRSTWLLQIGSSLSGHVIHTLSKKKSSNNKPTLVNSY